MEGKRGQTVQFEVKFKFLYPCFMKKKVLEIKKLEECDPENAISAETTKIIDEKPRQANEEIEVKVSATLLGSPGDYEALFGIYGCGGKLLCDEFKVCFRIQGSGSPKS